MDIKRLAIFFFSVIIVFFAFTVNIFVGIIAVIALFYVYGYLNRYATITKRAMDASSRGKQREALQLMEEAYKLNPKHPAVLANYSYLLLKSNQVDKAEDMLETLKKQNKIDKLLPNITMTQSLIRWKQGKLDEAISILEELQSKMQTTVLYGSLGYFYIEKGDLDRALDYNLQALDYNDSDAIILDNLLLTYILREEWDKADEISEKLMALSPKFPEAYYHDGLLKEHHGDLSGALSRYDTALNKSFSAVSTESRSKIEQHRDQLAKQLDTEDELTNPASPPETNT